VILQIDPRSGVPIYRQVMDQIRRLIMAGQLAEGERLEPVKNLSARLNVNPMTVSKAYGFLVEEGIVERRRGLGLFVNRIGKETKARIKTEMLEEALRKAAALAVQMGVPGEKALALFAGHLQGLDFREGRTGE
jgi:GntR family transcriptional regulator